MPIDKHLTPKEKIKSEFKDGSYDFYATNKRVIKYRKGLAGEDFDDLMYKHIISFSIKSSRRVGLIILGIFLIFMTFILSGFDISPILFIIGIIFIIAGIPTMNRGIFRAPGINPSDWTIRNVKSKEARDFIKIVREHIHIEKE